MTDYFVENAAQLNQLQALSAGRYRVVEALFALVPLIKQLAEDDATARHLLAELEAAQDAMKAENMGAASFVAERTESTSSP